MEYTVDFLISFFKNIPEEKFCQFLSDGKGARCYIGHCSGRSERLRNIFASKLSRHLNTDAGTIAYGNHSIYNEKSMKDRIVHALNDIKDNEIEEANIKAANEIIEKREHPSKLYKEQFADCHLKVLFLK